MTRAVLAAAALVGAAVAARADAHAPAPPEASRPAYADGAPSGFSGGFGEESCHGCHFHEAPNAAPGRVTLTGVPERYVAGRRYALTIILTRPRMAAGGFQLTVRHTSGGAQAGTLQPGPNDDPRVKVERPGAVEYAGHRRAGSRPVADDTLRWVVVWTAPSTGGPVQFHVAANAADNDETVSGDFAYTTTATAPPATP